MTPQRFPEHTNVLAKPADMTEAECRPLPVYIDGDTYVSCWGMTWRERLSVLLFGKVWLGVRVVNQPPVWVKGRRQIFPVPPPTEPGVQVAR